MAVSAGAPRSAGFLDPLPAACDVLRTYQRQQLAEIAAALRARKRRILVQLATGAGKTHEIAAVTLAASRAGLRVLIIATRTRLVRQIHDRLDAFGVRHGVIAAELRGMLDRFQLVQVCSADTLHRRCLADARMPLPPADVVIFDEAHLAAADSRMALLDAYPEALRIGFTATPARKSGRSLAAVFEHMILGPSMAQLIAAGFLVRPRMFCVPVVTSAELTALPRDAAGDYAEGAAGRLLSRPKLVGDVIANWLRIAPGKRSLVFACDKAHGAQLFEEFSRAGIAAELLTDQDDEPTREGVIARLESGATTVVINCFLMAYGVDLPAVECIVLARPTRSLTMYLQMVGRGMRPAPAKEHFTLIDHGRVVESLGLPTADFAWTLDDRRNVNAEAREAASRRSGVEQPRTCPECSHTWLVSELGNRCEVCGWAPTPRARPVTVEAADLAELDNESVGPVLPCSPAVVEFYRMACGWDMKRSPNLWKGDNPQTGRPNANRRRFIAWIRTRERFEFCETTDMPRSFWTLAPMEPSADVAGWLKYSMIRYARGRGRAA